MKGKCLCGKIEFEVELIPGMVFNCHCSRCRKSHGSAFATQVFAKKNTLKFITGKNYLSEFESEKGIRTFCSHCGSRLMNYGKEGVDYLSIAFSAMEEFDSNLKPIADCFTSEKFTWTEIDRNLKSYESYPDVSY